MWSGLNEELGAETGFRRTGLVYVTTSQADLDRYADWTDKAREMQMHSHVLSAAEAATMTPGSTGKWVGGIHSPTDGRAEPALAVPAIAQGARRLGVTIHQDCAARGLETSAGRVSGVVTEKGAIRASAVLVAGGVWTSMFCRHHGIDMKGSFRKPELAQVHSVEVVDPTTIKLILKAPFSPLLAQLTDRAGMSQVPRP